MLKDNKKKDLLIISVLVGLLLVILSIYVLVDYTDRHYAIQSQKQIGAVFELEGEVMGRSSKSLDWANVDKGTPVYADQFLFTNKGAKAKYVFLDKSFLQQSSDTLIHINSRFDMYDTFAKKNKLKISRKAGMNDEQMPEIELELVDGEVFLSLSKEGVIKFVKTKNGLIRPEGEGYSDVMIKNSPNNLEVNVVSGTINVKNDSDDYNVRERESYNKNAAAGGKLGSLSDKVVRGLEEQARADRKNSQEQLSKGDRKGFEEFVEVIIDIFLPFLK